MVAFTAISNLWRRALLAQKVLRGRTKGYRNHTQLARFRECPAPVGAIATYLCAVHDEAKRRGYEFDASKIARRRQRLSIPLTRGQARHELTHLKRKLRHRDLAKFRQIERMIRVRPHPIFKIVPGEIESCERVR